MCPGGREGPGENRVFPSGAEGQGGSQLPAARKCRGF
jgi:hypothetical protein